MIRDTKQKDSGTGLTEKIRKHLEQAVTVVIGAGAGLSEAAGFSYSGKRFREHFAEFIERYSMRDMYSAGFYPFQTQEEKWAYWSRHIYYNRYDQLPGKAYLDLLALVKNKDYFILTTNVDHQFWLAGFEEKRIFATQGDYGLFQCAKGCHNKLYDNEKQVRAMLAHQRDCRIPENLVPRCPVCGGFMEVNLRRDKYFVEDEKWHEEAKRYEAFLMENQNKRVVFLELGVGMNTPGIIKYPFQEMTRKWKNAVYICLNQESCEIPTEIEERSLQAEQDIAVILGNLIQENRLEFLNRVLKKELEVQIGADACKKLEVYFGADRSRLFRAFCNVRPPIPASEKFLSVQDAYLMEEINQRGVVEPESFVPTGKNERLFLWKGDITTLKAEAIVNAANSALLGCYQPCHSCIDNIIHTFAGVRLRLKCNELMTYQGREESAGNAKITPGYNLPCKYVIHTVGPVIRGPLKQEDSELLADCYRSCLKLAQTHGIRSIAFCCISTGVFHFPQAKAAEIAIQTASDFLQQNRSIRRIIFNVFTDQDFSIYNSILNERNLVIL